MNTHCHLNLLPKIGEDRHQTVDGEAAEIALARLFIRAGTGDDWPTILCLPLASPALICSTAASLSPS